MGCVLTSLLSAFKIVARATVAVEAHMSPTHLRLKQRAQCVSARLHTLPDTHPICEVLVRVWRSQRISADLRWINGVRCYSLDTTVVLAYELVL
jgi:hypothetical protein